MSVEAITWALRDAPNVPASCVSVLFGLANHADPDGQNAYPSVGRLAAYARKQIRQVQRDLDHLRLAGVITYGNSALTKHLRSDRRPQVYDLAMSTVTTVRGVTQDMSSPTERGVTDDMPSTQHGVSCETQRGVTHDRTGCRAVHPNRHEPSMNRQTKRTAGAHAREDTPDPESSVAVPASSPPLRQEPPSTSASSRPRRARSRTTASVTASDLAATAARPDAWQVVADWHRDQPVTHRTATRRALTKQIDAILRDQGDPTVARDALDAWAARSDARPGLVPYLYDDALKARHGARPRTSRTREDKVQAWLNLDPDDPASQPYSAREAKVQAWLDPALSDQADPAIEAFAAGMAGPPQRARIASTAAENQPCGQIPQSDDDAVSQRQAALIGGRSA